MVPQAGELETPVILNYAPPLHLVSNHHRSTGHPHRLWRIHVRRHHRQPNPRRGDSLRGRWVGLAVCSSSGDGGVNEKRPPPRRGLAFGLKNQSRDQTSRSPTQPPQPSRCSLPMPCALKMCQPQANCSR